jgi:hypothetical protein
MTDVRAIGAPSIQRAADDLFDVSTATRGQEVT